jgi:hypothetical protein
VTVYVDDMRAPFGRMIMSHMIADTTEELLTMAHNIGVQRKWIQQAGTYREHFDVASNRGDLAVGRFGAVRIDYRTAGLMIRERRRTGKLPLVFKEPGSGLLMLIGRWYLLSDSGSAYFPHGTDSAEEGRELALRLQGHDLEPEDVIVPAYTPESAWSDMALCNVLRADDLLHFWRTQDPETFRELNPSFAGVSELR